MEALWQSHHHHTVVFLCTAFSVVIKQSCCADADERQGEMEFDEGVCEHVLESLTGCLHQFCPSSVGSEKHSECHCARRLFHVFFEAEQASCWP